MRHYLAILVLVGLSSCGGKVETRISSAGEPNIGNLVYQFSENTGPQNSDLENARQLLTSALAARDIRQGNSAPIFLQVTLSDRAANLGLTKGGETKTTVISAPKKKKIFQNCKDREYRLAIRFSKISDGSIVYAGDVAEYHCNATVSESLPAMVSALVADIDMPGGDKTHSRRGKE